MASQCWLSLLLVLSNVLVDCASAAVHGHNVDTGERETDGSYRPRDADHYGNSGHNPEFDHEAIIGSVREAEEFDRLTPEEAKQRLAMMLPKMDVNGDKFIDRAELKQWILSSFISLSREEVTERLEEADENKDGIVTWMEYLKDTFGVESEDEIAHEDLGDSGMEASERLEEADENKDGIVTWMEYLKDTFGVESEDEIAHEDLGDSGMLVIEEKAMWKTADANGDGDLDAEEFEVFTNPEEHAKMHPHLVNQSLREKDTNKDGKIDFQEFIGERGEQNGREWLIAERDKFDNDLDANRDGHLDRDEIHKWIIPNNDEIADEEVDHLFASADDDHDDLLSFEEVIEHHDVFVGSEADMESNMGGHFDDEL